MYLDHFRLDTEPFSIAPDPRFLYLSEGHNEALAHLLYGFSHGGFVLITGEVGTGKTTLLRNLVKMTPDDLDVAFVLNPRLTVKELLETVCDELGIRYDKQQMQTIKQFIDLLNTHLLKVHQEGRSTVLIIDEAQNLSPAVLEQIRLLTNLETDEKKLLRIILIGQPELDDMLARKELRQLAQRITARYHLNALSAADTSAYVAHRITRAGGDAEIFPEAARKTLYKVTGGIPRLINVIADRALLGTYTKGDLRVTPPLVRQAADEIAGSRRKRFSPAPWIATATFIALLTALAWAWWSGERGAISDHPLSETQQPSLAPLEPPPPTKTKQQAQLEQTPPPAKKPAPKPAYDQVKRPPGSAYRSQRQAYAEIFARWGLEYNIDSPVVPCDFAPSEGLNCHSRQGSWDELRRMDLPVVLEFWDDEPLPFYGALMQMDETELELVVGSKKLITTPRQLRDLWFGNYTLVWSMPQHYRGNLQEGIRHPSVAILREELAQVMKVDLTSENPQQFDLRMAKTLEDFQRNQHMNADGIAGPITWVALRKILGNDMPALRGSR